MSNLIISIHDIHETLSNLNDKKVVGCDDVSPLVLKCCSGPMVCPITSCLTKVCLLLQFRRNEKSINFSQLAGDGSLFRNYRTVSLLCVLSNVLEVIMFKKVNHLSLRINVRQYGFMKGT